MSIPSVPGKPYRPASLGPQCPEVCEDWSDPLRKGGREISLTPEDTTGRVTPIPDTNI